MGESKHMASDLRVSITNASGKQSYPISGFTWLLIYKDQKDGAKAKAIVNFLKWAVTKGERFAADLYYAPLPKEVVKLCQKKIASITYLGKPVQ